MPVLDVRGAQEVQAERGGRHRGARRRAQRGRAGHHRQGRRRRVVQSAGGSHNSVAIEMKDHLVLVEAPLNDGRSVR